MRNGLTLSSQANKCAGICQLYRGKGDGANAVSPALHSKCQTHDQWREGQFDSDGASGGGAEGLTSRKYGGRSHRMIARTSMIEATAKLIPREVGAFILIPSTKPNPASANSISTRKVLWRIASCSGVGSFLSMPGF